MVKRFDRQDSFQYTNFIKSFGPDDKHEAAFFLLLATGKSLRKLSKVVLVLPMSLIKILYTCLFVLSQRSPNTSAILHG